MADAKSDSPETMEEVRESSSWGEWTIIHDDREQDPAAPVAPAPNVPEETPQDDTGDEDKEDQSTVVEEAREVLQVYSKN